MNEKEKMLKGLLYDACADKTLYEERIKCKSLCFEYNNLPPDKIDERNSLIEKILGKKGQNCWIEPSFWCDYGYNIKVGENFYSNHNLVILDPAGVTFGNNIFIGPNCGFYTAQHPLDFKTRNKGLEYAYEIKVGSNVWFGGNVVVLPGITIGNNCVIGAGSVVTKNIPDNVVAAGNPAKIIKKIDF